MRSTQLHETPYFRHPSINVTAATETTRERLTTKSSNQTVTSVMQRSEVAPLFCRTIVGFTAHTETMHILPLSF